MRPQSMGVLFIHPHVSDVTGHMCLNPSVSLGIQQENILVDFEEGDTVRVIAGAWADTVGVIQAMNVPKQSLTINVELFGRETPVEISFAEVKKI